MCMEKCSCVVVRWGLGAEHRKHPLNDKHKRDLVYLEIIIKNVTLCGVCINMKPQDTETCWLTIDALLYCLHKHTQSCTSILVRTFH